MKLRGEVLCLGDFNAHLGIDDDLVKQSNCFGKILLHPQSNSNGHDLQYICELFNMHALTTIRNNSTKITWHRGASSSQLDHILYPSSSAYRVNNLQGRWSKSPSDHKIISCQLVFRPNNNQTEYHSFPKALTYRSKTWNWALLADQHMREQFETLFQECLKSERETGESVTWNRVSAIACFCAENLLKSPPRQFTAEQVEARNDLSRLMQHLMRPRIVDSNPLQVDPLIDYPPAVIPGSIQLIRAAHKRFAMLNNDSTHQSLSKFLDSLNDAASHPAQRLQLAFKHLKIARRSQQCTPLVTMKNWQDEELLIS